MNTITGSITDGFPGVVTVDGVRLDPEHSKALYNHSPDGFAWGYAGSGPAQTALGILLHVVGEELALRHYQEFKVEHVATWEQKPFEVEIDVEGWVAAREQAAAEVEPVEIEQAPRPNPVAEPTDETTDTTETGPQAEEPVAEEAEPVEDEPVST